MAKPVDLIVFSCVTGGIDDIRHLLTSRPLAQPGVFCILFTDAKLDWDNLPGTDRWEIRPTVWQHPTNPRRTARFHKINSHVVLPPHNTCCWVDGSLQIRQDVDLLLLASKYLDTDVLATFKHPLRRCVYQELDACIKLRKDHPPTMRQQIARYRAEGYPPLAGMVETSCVLRRTCPQVTAFNQAWWREIERGSLRDQLSFNYVARKLAMAYGIIPGCRDKSSYFEFHKHRHP